MAGKKLFLKRTLVDSYEKIMNRAQVVEIIKKLIN